MKTFFFIFTFLLSIVGYSQILGCTDPMSKNYNPLATKNDGSCKYANAKVGFSKSFELNEMIKETSGLLAYDGYLWTHNDDKDVNLYGFSIDSILSFKKSKINFSKKIPLVKTKDWEAIAQDSLYFYVGDFGNNYRGNRKDLTIYKIKKDNLHTITPLVFTYENQTEFTQQKPNKTNFDCEAMISLGDYLYLFTKEWTSKKTTVYKVLKSGENQVAQKVSEFDVAGLITDATYLADKNLLVLLGYSSKINPFIYVFYDFEGDNFFGANKRKINLKANFYQTEGIATTDGLTYFVSNEKLRALNGIIDVKPQIHVLNLSAFLTNYISKFAEVINLGEEYLPVEIEIEE